MFTTVGEVRLSERVTVKVRFVAPSSLTDAGDTAIDTLGGGLTVSV